MPATKGSADSSCSMNDIKIVKGPETSPDSLATAMPRSAVLSPASPMVPGSASKDTGVAAAKAGDGETRKAKRLRTKTIPAEASSAEAHCAEDDSKTLESGTWLIVAKSVRMYLKNNETAMHCGADALPALNAKLADLLRDAMQRAQCNGRKTLKACDF